MSKIVVNGHFKVVLVKQLVLEVETLRIPGSSIQASPLAADLGEKRQVFTSVSEKAFSTAIINNFGHYGNRKRGILLHFWRTVRRRRGRSPGSGNPPRERAKALSY